jgi:signal transduction histidine kinase
MSPIGSLRGRVWVGAILWTIGLFALAGVLLTQVMYLHPNSPVVVHRVFLHVGPISVFALLLLLVGLIQVSRGVSPIAQLRHRVSAIRGGDTKRVDGKFPSEVQPLVDDLNTMLEARDRVVERAQAKAGDLAHGLKTPLAVLLKEADAAERAGHVDVAAAIRQQVDRMQRQMDYHLAHARAAASGVAPGTRTPVADAAEGLARTLRRLHADRMIEITVDVPAGHTAATERIDLEEMLGNLMDNACKWAASKVTVSTRLDGSFLVCTVDDDGPGVEEALLESVLQRGVRADETAPGSGFGLAIVRDLSEVYGGTIVLSHAPIGGLRAELRLPAAH